MDLRNLKCDGYWLDSDSDWSVGSNNSPQNGNFICELLTKLLVLVYVKYNQIQYNKIK